MVVGESRHCVITMIVPVLEPKCNGTFTLCSFRKIFWQQLTLLVEIICGTLYSISRRWEYCLMYVRRQLTRLMDPQTNPSPARLRRDHPI